MLFEYEGCNLVDDFCDCRKEMACINPFEYQSRHQCVNDLHKQPGECQNVKCRKIKHNKNVSECPSDSKLITGRWTDDGCCPVENRLQRKKYCDDFLDASANHAKQNANLTLEK